MTNQLDRVGRFLRSPRFPIFMIMFVDVLGVGITIPVLPLFAKTDLGAAAWQVTTLTSVYFVAQFFAAPWLGRLSDRVGRRPVLILSQAGTLAALIITGLAPSIVILYLARIVDGLTGGNISVAQAYLSDITDEKNRARGLGVVNAAFGLGFIFGPAFGGIMAARFGPRVPFFAAAVVSLCTVLLSTFLLPESLPPERRKRETEAAAQGEHRHGLELIAAPAVGVLLAVAFLSQFSFFGFQTIYVLWSQKLVFPTLPRDTFQEVIGAILTFVGVVGIVTQFWLVGPLVRRFGEKRLVLFGNLSRLIAFATFALTASAVATIGVIPLLAGGGGVALPATIALLTYAAPPGERGHMVGLYQSAAALGSVAGPILSGYLFEQVNPNAPMVAAAILMALTVAFAVSVQFMKVESPQHAAAH